MSEYTTAEMKAMLKGWRPPDASAEAKSELSPARLLGCVGSGKPSIISERSGRVMCPVCTKYVRVEAGQKTPKHKEASGHRKFRY